MCSKGKTQYKYAGLYKIQDFGYLSQPKNLTNIKINTVIVCKLNHPVD
jgi:hypothetical protein